MPFDSIEIRDSTIQGRGVYAKRVFKAGEIVLRWDLSHTIPTSQLATLPDDERRYTHPLDEHQTLIVQAPERFVNHSCAPNTEVREFCDVALCRIEVDEEITSDYGDVGAAVGFECKCGNDKCRKQIGPESSML
jgi:SET domain-containing protein